MSTSLFDSSLALPAANAAIPPQPLCPSDLPLVLLPVRLETRFFTLPNNATELRIRVYPDQIHLDTHEPELTNDERTGGTQYWQADWASGDNTDARRDAWRILASRFGAPRAAWIVRALEPTNLQQRPSVPVANGQPPAVPPVFPALPAPSHDSAWRRAPQARLLPDRWIAVLHSARQVALTIPGRDIRRPLAVGPDPRAPEPDPQTRAAIERGDRLAIDDGMRWMVDFDEAERAGMGLRVTVPPATLAAGLDSLLVFGVVRSLGVADTAAQLADLLDAHHHTDGLEFIRDGTPTNNTDDRRAGYSSEDPGHARSFSNEIMTDPHRSANAQRVGTALGLPFPRIAPTLGRLGHAAQDHELDMRSMNTALWQVGWGYFLSNMIGAETGLTPLVGLGARAFRQLREERRSLALPALRAAAVRDPAGHLARPVGRPAPARRSRRRRSGSGACLSACATRSGVPSSTGSLASASGVRPTPTPTSPMSCAWMASRPGTTPARYSAATMSSIFTR